MRLYTNKTLSSHFFKKLLFVLCISILVIITTIFIFSPNLEDIEPRYIESTKISNLEPTGINSLEPITIGDFTVFLNKNEREYFTEFDNLIRKQKFTGVSNEKIIFHYDSLKIKLANNIDNIQYENMNYLLMLKMADYYCKIEQYKEAKKLINEFLSDNKTSKTYLKKIEIIEDLIDLDGGNIEEVLQRLKDKLKNNEELLMKSTLLESDIDQFANLHFDNSKALISSSSLNIKNSCCNDDDTILNIDTNNVFLNAGIAHNCHIDDWTALKAVYEFTNGYNWLNRTGWEIITGNEPIAKCDLGNLYGVNLNENGRVSSLNLFNNQLSGGIPAKIGNLSNLKFLRLHNNKLTGTIPTEIGSLASLTMLSLSSNELSGSIPPELGNLTNLTTLSLCSNQFNGSIPRELGNLTNLKELDLSNNKLDGRIPFEVRNLSNSAYLDLAHNNFSDSISNYYGYEAISLSADLENISANNSLHNYFNNVNKKGKTHALLIGINDYKNVKDLHYSINDVNLLKETLENNFSKARNKLELTTLTDKEATKQNILQALKNIKAQVKPEDNILIYFVGHGNEMIARSTENVIILKQSKSKTTSQNILPYEYTKGSASSHISIDSIHEIFKDTNTENSALLIVDACRTIDGIEDDVYSCELNSANLNYQSYREENPLPYYSRDVDLVAHEIAHSIGSPHKDACYQSPQVDFGGTIMSYCIFDPEIGVNLLNGFGKESRDQIVAYYVKSDTINNIYPDSISVYILDSGLDVENFKAYQFLWNYAPNDICYDIEKSHSYAYIVDTVANLPTNYSGDVWHGTFGYGLITDVLEQETKLILTPLKIFNAENKLSQYSNFGKQSLSIAAPGEYIFNYALEEYDVIASGTSMSTFLITQALALDFAKIGNGDCKQTLQDFEGIFLIDNHSSTAKSVNFETVAARGNTTKPKKNKQKHKHSKKSTKDSRNNLEVRRTANKIVGKLNAHALLFGGDMTTDGTNEEWMTWLNNWQLSISENNRITPLIVCSGNHEDNAMIADLFDTSAEVYHANSFGGNLFRTYTLNSESPIFGSQTDWLEEDFNNNQEVIWKLAQYHTPMRPHVASKAEGSNQYAYWANLFYQYSADIVMEGDAHTAKTTWPVIPCSGGFNCHQGFKRNDAVCITFIGEGTYASTVRPNNDTKLKPKLIVLNAASAGDKSFGLRKINHGIFTYNLVNSLNKDFSIDLNKDNYVSLQESKNDIDNGVQKTKNNRAEINQQSDLYFYR